MVLLRRVLWMGKASDKSCCKYSKQRIIRRYVRILDRVDRRMKKRNRVLARHFKLLLEPRSEMLNTEAWLAAVLEKPLQLPPLCLSSSLGFNKHTWNKGTEALLSTFSLAKKPRHPTLRNVLLFEKLKLLVVKLQERERKKK